MHKPLLKLLTRKIHNGRQRLAIYLLLFSSFENNSAPARLILLWLLGLVLLCNRLLLGVSAYFPD